jgi:hypothetical protein
MYFPLICVLHQPIRRDAETGLLEDRMKGACRSKRVAARDA